MKIIKKFWGVALVLILLSTLFFSAAPVSAAQVLRWENKTDTPIALFNVLAPGSNIVGYDVNGATMYAVGGTVPGVGSQALFQTTSGGAMWTDISARLNPAVVGTADFVAIAPDNASIVAVATNTAAAGLCIQISVNAGLTFTSMGVVQDATFTNQIATINGIAISPVIAGGFRYIAVFGVDTAGNAAVDFYNYGAGVGSWKDAAADFTGVVNPFPAAFTVGGTLDAVYAFQFSPIFNSDYMAEAVLYDATTGAFDLHEVSFNAGGNWDTEPGYPANVYTDAAAPAAFTAINKVSLVLNPGYDGSDETSRIAFIGADFTDSVATQVGGVFRAIDSSVSRIFGVTVGQQIWSIAFDGTNVAAGASITNNVFRSVNPLASSPTFSSARNLKRIGTVDGADNVIVKYVAGTLYGGKSGVGSCMSKSTDYGNTWNDFALIDDNYQAAGTIDDIYVTDAGDPWFMSTDDTVTTNIYRIAGFGVTRVLCVPTGVNFVLRGIGSNATLLYAADVTVGSDIYYTADGGLQRWFKRTSPVGLADLVVDSPTTIFVGDALTGDVYKSTNSGFTWGSAQTTGLILAVVHMYALGNGNVVAGGVLGDVCYTTNGGDSWNFTINALAAANLVSASGLAAGDYIFAADTASANVYRCLVGPGNPFGEWVDMGAPTTAAETNTGIVYKSGVLYTIADDPVTGSYLNRNTLPTFPGDTLVPVFWSTTFNDAAKFNAYVGAFQATIANNVFTLYTIDTTATPGNTVRYFQDTLALASPTLTGPADGALIQLTSALIGTSQNVNLTWNRLSLATTYLVFVALDEAFTQPIGAPTPVASAASIVSCILPGAGFNPGNTYYWRVMVIAPMSSGFSETRSFTIVANAAAVPDLASPEIGASLQPGQIAFSWTPLAGTTSYQFQLDTGAVFTAPLYSATVTSAGASLPPTVNLETGRMYFWRVKALTPTEGDWSAVGNFTVASPVTTSQTTTTTVSTTVTNTTITIPPATSTIITVPPATQTVEEVNPTYIWAIIIIGAVLVLAVIVLIVRTRRSV